MTLETWCQRWNVPPAALQELFGIPPAGRPAEHDGKSEAFVQQQVQLEAPKRGWMLCRNNIGACVDQTGRNIRYGLGNTSKQMNEVIKSSDLIGISDSGQFLSFECKKPSWTYKGTPREVAQLAWISLIRSKGGIGKFITGLEDL